MSKLILNFSSENIRSFETRLAKRNLYNMRPNPRRRWLAVILNFKTPDLSEVVRIRSQILLVHALFKVKLNCVLLRVPISCNYDCCSFLISLKSVFYCHLVLKTLVSNPVEFVMLSPFIPFPRNIQTFSGQGLNLFEQIRQIYFEPKLMFILGDRTIHLYVLLFESS